MNHRELWEHRRRALSHDWFKDPRNILAKWLNVLAGAVTDRSFSPAVALESLRTWELMARDECASLADTYVAEMSPRMLFGRAPLDRCGTETQSWLAPLAHDLWVARTKPFLRTDRLKNAVAAVDEAYGELFLALGSATSTSCVDVDLVTHIRRLQVALAGLSSALSDFPRKIEVV